MQEEQGKQQYGSFGSTGSQQPAEQLTQQARQAINQVTQTLSSQQQKQKQFEPVFNEVISRIEYVATGRPTQSKSQVASADADTLVKSMDGETLARHARHTWDNIKRELPVELRGPTDPVLSSALERLEFASIGSQQSNSS